MRTLRRERKIHKRSGDAPVNTAQLTRLRRARRYEQGDCAWCGIRERGEGVLCDVCREKNNSRRRKGGARGHSAEVIKAVRDAIVAGESRRSISRRMGFSSATIWRWTREAA